MSLKSGSSEDTVKKFDMSGKVVLITGAGGGLGKAFVKTFLENGAKVFMGDINKESGNRVVDELSGEFGESNVKFGLCDVTKDRSFEGAFKKCEDVFGPVDILVNNAGIGNEKDWQLTMDVNLGGTIRGTELAIQHMSKEKGHNGGHVVNIASISGLKVIPFGPFYSASKSAIIQYTRTAGHPFHLSYHGVNIKCLCPSLVDTPLLRAGSATPYSPQSAATLKKLFGTFPLMGTDQVTKALCQLLEDSKPGSVMVVEKDKAPYYSDPPIAT